MAGIALPSAGTVKKSASKKKSSGKKKKSTTGSRARMSQAKVRDVAIVAGEFLGAGAAWSAASAYQASKGKDLRIGKMVDARILVGVAGIAAGLWKPKVLKLKKIDLNAHAMNVGLGTLASWAHEYAFEQGASYFQKSAAPVASEGVVLGALGDDEAGLFGRKRKLKRIERRLARLRKRRTRIRSKLAAKGRLPDYGESQYQGSGRGQAGFVRVPAWAVRPAYRRQMAQ